LDKRWKTRGNASQWKKTSSVSHDYV
jgi:hypothetical protein